MNEKRFPRMFIGGSSHHTGDIHVNMINIVGRMFVQKTISSITGEDSASEESMIIGRMEVKCSAKWGSVESVAMVPMTEEDKKFVMSMGFKVEEP